jgi:hypothetical protein
MLMQQGTHPREAVLKSAEMCTLYTRIGPENVEPCQLLFVAGQTDTGLILLSIETECQLHFDPCQLTGPVSVDGATKSTANGLNQTRARYNLSTGIICAHGDCSCKTQQGGTLALDCGAPTVFSTARLGSLTPAHLMRPSSSALSSDNFCTFPSQPSSPAPQKNQPAYPGSGPVTREKNCRSGNSGAGWRDWWKVT